MTSKHGDYSSAMRLGRSLKDRCTKSDPERDVLAAMLDLLKNKWNSLRSGATQRYDRYDTIRDETRKGFLTFFQISKTRFYIFFGTDVSKSR